MNLYTIIFNDNTTFFGGTLESPNWLNIPDKKIRSIFYQLPLGDMLCLANFKRIYHYIEVTQDIYMGNQGKVNLEFAHLLIERENKVIHYKIDLKTNNILVEILDIDDKFILGLNKMGWK